MKKLILLVILVLFLLPSCSSRWSSREFKVSSYRMEDGLHSVAIYREGMEPFFLYEVNFEGSFSRYSTMLITREEWQQRHAK